MVTPGEVRIRQANPEDAAAIASAHQKTVAVGVDDHRGWANLVSVALHGGRAVVVDRRRIELIHPDLPGQPHHHEAQDLALDEARELVRRVAKSIAESCRPAVRALAEDLAGRGYRPVAMVLRAVPEVPDDLGVVLENQAASIAADAALYLRGLAGAAADRATADRDAAPGRVLGKIR